MRRFAAVPVLASLVALGATAPALASTIEYQCGPDVCAVDPDVAGSNHQLVAGATATGITRDGATVAWTLPNPQGIVLSPVGGGATTPLFTGPVYSFPRLAPDGAHVLWEVFIATQGWYTYQGPGTTGVSSTSVVASAVPQTTHGWMNAQPIVAFRGFESNSSLSTICAPVADAPNCATVLASDPDSQVSFPDGAPDGQSIVAVRGPAPSTLGAPTEGIIALYSTATHTRVRDLTSGPADSRPAFSAEGDRVAFERSGGIWVVDVAGGEPRKVADGTAPFWGGARTVAGSGGSGGGGGFTGGGAGGSTGGGGSSTPGVLSFTGKHRLKDLTGGKVRLTTTCATACKATATFAVSASTARKLRLGRARTIGTGKGNRGSAGTVTVALKLTKAAKRRLKGRTSVAGKLTTVVTPKGGKAVTRTASTTFGRR
ncbi:TolB family protein [Patulibacter minatonensis]|uniref:TolB family protein n=1 Tax=Patulibacter minatonensis TaxID=298163 RepID=UPI000478B7A5|nr:hypothetical protein [Patulibacter minatonensis]